MKVAIVPPATVPPAPETADATSPPQHRAALQTRRALRAVFFREFQPHLPAALCLLGICGLAASLVALEMYVNAPDPHDMGVARNVLFDELVRFLTTTLCPIFGLVLGMLQARRDQAPEIWALMVHRPVPRWILFAGRVLAGLALYGIAAGLPLAVLLAYAASSYGGQPFEHHMMYPVIADGLSGLMFYFAGQVVIQRAGWMFGPRLLPLVMCVGCSILLGFVPGFGGAVLLTLVFTALFAAAALGAVYSNGYRLPAHWSARWAAGLIQYSGLALLLFGISAAVVAMRFNITESEIRDLPAPVEQNHLLQTQLYVVLADATLGLRTYAPPVGVNIPETDSDKYMSYQRVWPVKEELDRETINREPPSGARPRVESFQALAGLSPADHFRRLSVTQEAVFSPVTTQSAPGQIKEDWYYVAPPGVYVGYDHATHAYLGEIGEDGFAPPGKSAAPFGIQVSGPLITPRGAFVVDLQARSVRCTAKFPADVELYFRSNDGRFAVAAHGQLLIYDPAHVDPVLALPLAHPLHDDDILKGNISIRYYPEQKRWILAYTPRGTGATFEFFDEMGKQLGRVDVPWLFQTEWSAGHPPGLPADAMAIERHAFAEYGIIHAAGGLPWNLLLLAGIGPGSQLSFADLRLMPQEDWPLLTAYGISAGVMLLLSGAAMFFLARWYAVRWKWLWVAATIALGPVMLLLLLALHSFPRRVKCPGCGRRVLTEAETCPKCGTPAAQPALNGTEIFAAP